MDYQNKINLLTLLTDEQHLNASQNLTSLSLQFTSYILLYIARRVIVLHPKQII